VKENIRSLDLMVTNISRRSAMRLLSAVMIAATCLSTPAMAASWEGTRERSMRLKEAGRYVEAYQTSAGFRSGSSEEMFDKEFVSGWIALRNLNRTDIALDHFKKMASHISGMKSFRQGVAKSKAGYWLGRALKSSGRTSEAERLFKASMAYPTTFYGQLSAGELKIKLDKSKMPASVVSDYPVRQFYWHDSRVPKPLVLAVIREESGFKISAQSGKGAQGMMQVMEGTALHVGKTAGVNIDVRMMKKSADYNVAVGSRYLGDLLSSYNGNPMLSLAGYNAGPLRADEWMKRFGDPRSPYVDKVDWAENIPFKETRDYVQKVMGSYMVYRALLNE
jgi:soluble lytic murein transglycosylase-like protein